MMTMAEAELSEAVGRYRHEAVFYSGRDEFAALTAEFIERAASRGDPVLAVVSQPKIDLLREHLGAGAASVKFADMAAVGANPARIIATWREFVAAHAGTTQLWGVGEPAYPGRSPAELAECQLHEALLNLAFDASTPFWLLCPYDIEALAADVIRDAQHTHPFISWDGERQACDAFQEVNLAGPFDRPVPARPATTVSRSFQFADLPQVRAFIADQAVLAGLGEESAEATVLSVNEIVTNSIRHGGGSGELHIWTDGSSLVCEVTDAGHITSPLVGRVRPAPDALGGGGLWLANQLCDLVEIYSSARGTVVRTRMYLQG
jgi:anti-sigma regulatory factor (Ser/Thr protein kinase)